MSGKDDRVGAPGARPAVGNGQSRGGSAGDVSRGKDGGGGAGMPLSGNGRDGEREITGSHNDDRDGRTALGKQTIGGAFDQHDAGTRGRPFQPPAILRAPSSLVSHPLFLHPVPQLGVPFRAPSIPPPLPAPLVFVPPVGAPQPPIPADSPAPQTQTPDVLPQPTQPPTEVPSPKVELSVTPSAIDTAPTSVETPSSTVTPPASASPAPSPESAIASTTSDSAPDISPIIVPAASLVDTSFANPDILPVTNSGVGVGGKVAAACVIGAVLLLLVNWAFWLLIRRRRRARRSLPAHWDFAAPPPAKDVSGRDSQDAFAHSELDGPVKGGMVTVPV